MAADAPETVTDAINLLRQDGYTEDFDVRDGSVCCKVGGEWQPAEPARMERTYRFEGTSDPADEMIVVGVHWTDTDRRGVLVSAYGKDTAPDDAEALRNLLDDRHRGT